MQLRGAVALVSGGKRGMGNTTARALLAEGAAKVYVADTDEITIAEIAALDATRAIPLHLDITKHDQVSAAARRYGDVSILINNAGINRGASLLRAESIDNARAEMEVNFFGTLGMCRAFAPVLKKNGGGAIVNMLSVLARMPYSIMGSYCASKAALLSLTYTMRAELASQGIRVIGVFPGPVDTRMTPGGEMQPAEVSAAIIAALKDDADEVWPGARAAKFRDDIQREPQAVEREHAKVLAR
jgi:NAD(P)-dependent dehydrogenase (short-subunit alcohol dehydrogenase family)